MYISSGVLKTSDFSRVRSTNEDSDVFNSRDEIYIWYLPKKSIFFYLIGYMLYVRHPLKKEVLNMQKRKFLAKPNNFDTQMFVTF